MSKLVLRVSMIVCLTAAMSVQGQQPTAPPTDSKAIESALGVFIYPKADQDTAQQSKDSAECYASAKEKDRR